MGNHGTTNALLNFGDESITPDGRPGAVGYLVGQEFDGLSQMFHMMNEARVGVGLAAAAQGYTGYLQALSYARTRLQGRSISRGGGSQDVPIVSHHDVRRMLLAQKSYVEGALGLGQRLDEIEMVQPTAFDVAHDTPAIRGRRRESARLTAEFRRIELGGGDDEWTGQTIEVALRAERLLARVVEAQIGVARA
jgi:alkylation response protein AidB-like acyl-CoA dehydrogenase